MTWCGSGELAEGLASGAWAAAPPAPAREQAREQARDEEPLPFDLPGDQPRYAPDRPADVRHMAIAITLDFDQRAITGDVTTRFVALFEEVREVTLDAAELRISAITLAASDTPLTWWSEGEKLHIRLDRAYPHGEEFAVRVRYSATPRAGLVFVEPTAGDPGLQPQVWTQGETEYHHYWLPCHDFPNDRATTTLRATVPGRFFVLSNGVLEGREEHTDGTATYTWRMDVPFPAYLITLVAGEFAELPNAWREIAVNSYVPAGREADGRRMLGKTPAMIAYFSERFGVDYPYPKYAQVVAEQFTGAMENASATTHSYRLLADERASLDFTPEPVVAHELAHQWFGDLIAVRDWSQTWLKESFADFFEVMWTEHDRGEDEAKAEVLSYLRIYLEADKRGRRPIVHTVYRKNGNELFDRHAYEKGALVLNMLRHVLGEAAFWRGIQTYAQRNSGREVITADFERALEEATGRSLARFFAQWVYRAGYPAFTVRYAWDDEQRLATLTIRQTQRTDERTPVFATPVDLGFFVPEREPEGEGGDVTDAPARMVVRRVMVETTEQTVSVPLERRPLAVRFDQGGWLLKTLDFERPSALLRYQLRHDPDPLGRIEAAEALGKLADAESFAALERALGADPFWAVRRAAAAALAESQSAPALDALLAALPREQHPKARRGVVAALGAFRTPEQGALAERAAAALAALLEHGDPSYYVEAEAATSLGKTRAPGALETLLALVDRSSWNEIIRAGVFAGMGELGDPRAVDVLASWATDRARPMDARAGAAHGLRLLAETHRVEGEAKARAVAALCAAVFDPWHLVQRAALGALGAWGDRSAIPALRRVASTHPDEHMVRGAREAIRDIERGGARSDAVRALRDDVAQLREENRRLREHLEAIAARLAPEAPAANGHPRASRAHGA